MADPVKVPVNVAVTLKMIIVFGPARKGGPAKLKQGLKPPLTGPGVPASTLGKVNDAPTIASAQKLLRGCDRKRFRLNQQLVFRLVFIQTSKGTGTQSSGIFWSFWSGASLLVPNDAPANRFFKLVEGAENNHATGR